MTTITMKDKTMITINGKSYHGQSISIVNNVVTIDGKVQEGAVNVLDKKIDIQIHGPAHMVSTASGNIGVNGNVTGNAESVSGNVRCKDVGGNVSTVSGDVTADSIAGKVSTVSGDIST